MLTTLTALSVIIAKNTKKNTKKKLFSQEVRLLVAYGRLSVFSEFVI